MKVTNPLSTLAIVHAAIARYKDAVSRGRMRWFRTVYLLIRRFFLWLCVFFVIIPTLSSATSADGPRRDFRQALPGYQFRFPDDHGSHDEFRTEWWYYTGHLTTEDGREFGYELTFFRQAIDDARVMDHPSRWAIRHLYLAHAALSDIEQRRFRYAEKVSRAGIGKAGADTGRLYVWIDRWCADVSGDPRRHHLRAASEDFSFDLFLDADKGPIVHGDGGISKKGAEPGQASHYYSMTRLTTTGTLMLDGRSHRVHGISWMDHEFGSGTLGRDQVGWDWFSLQLDGGFELMFYLLRRADGTADPVSSGTWISPDGTSAALPLSEVQIQVLGHWTSPASQARYPNQWRISIPSRHVSLLVTPSMPNQELITEQSTQVTYWEGAVTATGRLGATPITGLGYVELTGYAKPFSSTR